MLTLLHPQDIERAWTEGVAPARPFRKETIEAYIEYLVADKGKKMTTENGEAVQCGGLNAPSVLKAVWAIGAIENAYGQNSNVHDPLVMKQTKKLSAAWFRRARRRLTFRRYGGEWGQVEPPQLLTPCARVRRSCPAFAQLCWRMSTRAGRTRSRRAWRDRACSSRSW